MREWRIVAWSGWPLMTEIVGIHLFLDHVEYPRNIIIMNGGVLLN